MLNWWQFHLYGYGNPSSVPFKVTIFFSYLDLPPNCMISITFRMNSTRTNWGTSYTEFPSGNTTKMKWIYYSPTTISLCSSNQNWSPHILPFPHPPLSLLNWLRLSPWNQFKKNKIKISKRVHTTISFVHIFTFIGFLWFYQWIRFHEIQINWNHRRLQFWSHSSMWFNLIVWPTI